MKDATLKELRRLFANRKPSQLLQSCEESIEAFSTQGFKANPGLKLANAFSVTALEFSHNLGSGVGLVIADCQLTIFDWRLAIEALGIGNRKSKIRGATRVPRGGTDLTTLRRSLL